MPSTGCTRSDPDLARRSIDCAKTSLCSLLSFGFGFGFCDRVITSWSFRDLAITAFSAVTVNGGNLQAHGPRIGPEYQRDPVVINDAPAAGFLQRAAQGRTWGHQNRVHSEAGEGLLPSVLHVEDVNVFLFEIVTVEIAPAIDEDFVA